MGLEFVVRLWDGMDGVWTDVTEPLPKEEADKVWREKTENGTKKVSFDEIDYYQVFPASTRMIYSGDHTMFSDDR